ncbi:MAG TPA: hypothetical protein EYG40_14125 [Verrucomicrobia bacterium]|nr:hypothetical protein [Verrucomicrobiales bacterium]HIL56158.1 hypothetical protein [Verrucomicrobiota bacterium]
MKLSDITNVLSFAAFRPDPDDSSCMWRKRFRNKQTLLLNFSKEVVSWRSVSKDGVLGEENSIAGSVKEVVQDMSEDWLDLTDGGWCAVSINHRFVISLETNLTRKNGVSELIRTNPKAVLGSKSERGKRYALKHNDESNSSILLAVDEDYIKEIETLFKSSGLKIGRICCGIYGMLSESLDQISEAQKDYNENVSEPLGDVILITCCEGSVCILKSDQEKWIELRSRNSLYTQKDMEPLRKIIAPIVEALGSNAQIVLSADETVEGISQMLSELAPNARINDMSDSYGLWNLLKNK